MKSAKRQTIRFDHKEDMCKQSFKDECNINRIMDRFQRTGAIDHYAKHGPSYGDATAPQLAEAMNIVADAETMFQDLPSRVRKYFDNDTGKFLEFVQDENNLEKMRELGLANAKPTLPVQPEDQASTINENAPASEEKTVNMG